LGEKYLWNNIIISSGEEFFSVDSFDLRYFGAVGIFLSKKEAEFAIDEIERSIYPKMRANAALHFFN